MLVPNRRGTPVFPKLSYSGSRSYWTTRHFCRVVAGLVPATTIVLAPCSTGDDSGMRFETIENPLACQLAPPLHLSFQELSFQKPSGSLGTALFRSENLWQHRTQQLVANRVPSQAPCSTGPKKCGRVKSHERTCPAGTPLLELEPHFSSGWHVRQSRHPLIRRDGNRFHKSIVQYRAAQGET